MEGTQAFADETAQQQVCDAYDTVSHRITTASFASANTLYSLSRPNKRLWMHLLEKASSAIPMRVDQLIPGCKRWRKLRM